MDPVPRLLAAAAVALGSLLLSTAAASAAVDPYPAGTTGYDDSVGQCGTPPRGAFGVIAATSGRPFSQNSCLAAEYASSHNGGVYVNTGYARAYANRITSECSSAAEAFSGGRAQRQAYAIGCSEAAGDISYAAAQGVAPPVWWLDVETANSWSTSDLTLNQAAIQGLVDRFQGAGAVGIYSTSAQWAQLMGTWSPARLDANWVAGAASAAEAPSWCGRSITGAPVWLVQYVDGLDQDYAC